MSDQQQRRRSSSQQPSLGGGTGIPRATRTTTTSTGIPRPSSGAGAGSRIPSASGTGVQGAIKRASSVGVGASVPAGRTSTVPSAATPRSAIGTPSSLARRPSASRGTSTPISAQQFAGQKRRASQTYVLDPNAKENEQHYADANGDQAEDPESEKDRVFQEPLRREDDALDSGRPAKRFFGGPPASARLSNASAAGRRESMTSVADLSTVRHDYQVRLVQAEAKTGELERELLDKVRQLERFQKERLDMLAEWEALQEQKAQREQQHSKEVETLRNELKECREFLGISENDLDEKTKELDQLRQSARQESTRLELELIEARQLKETAEAEKARVDKENDAIRREMEEMRKDPTMTMGVAKRASEDEAASNEKLREELKRQVANTKTLQATSTSLRAENERIKAQLSSVEVLREEKLGLEAKVRSLERQNLELLTFEAEAKRAEQEKERWEESLRQFQDAASAGVPSAVSVDPHAVRIAEAGSEDAEADSTSNALAMPSRPAQLTRNTLPPYLLTLEASLAAALSKIRALFALRKDIAAERKRLEEEIEAGEKRLLEGQQVLSERRIQVEKAELAEKRAREECDRYKSLLDSFQMEQKMKKTSFDEANLQRIDLLEEQLRSLQEENEKLSVELKSVLARAEAAELAAANTAAEPAAAKPEQDPAAQKQYEAQIASLEKELEKIASENDTLWSRVGRGEFDQAKYQVLTLSGGPLARDRDLRTKKLDALRAENEALLKRVDELSQAVGQSQQQQTQEGMGSDWVPRAKAETLSMEVEALQAEMKVKNKAMLRLREVFQRKADEYNEAVRCLFGWKLKFLGSSGKVKLVSDFSKSAKNKTTLVFRPSEQGDTGDMRLTGEALKEGMADIQGLSEKWLQQDALYSIPCFLSEINVQLFESCTRARVLFGIPPEEEEDDE